MDRPSDEQADPGKPDEPGGSGSPDGSGSAPTGLDDPRRRVIVTSIGVGLVAGGLTMIAVSAGGLRWLGVAIALAGVAVVAVPRSQPRETGEEEPIPVELGDGRLGTAFVWSRYAPSMTILTFSAAAGASAALAAFMVFLGTVATAMAIAVVCLFTLHFVWRALPVLRARRLVVLDDGVVVEMRGERAEWTWSAITRIDVARPNAQAAAMGGAITLRVARHAIPGPDGLRRRLRGLAAPYGGADVALPVAGLRHDPGTMLAALERGRHQADGTAEAGPA